MKKLLRILLWTAGILAVLIIVAVVGLKLFFPAEKVKAMAIERGSAALGRPIAVEGLDISVWGGIGVELQNVAVGNPEGIDGPDLLAAENVDLKLQLLPLISGDIMVDRLIIEAPTVQLTKGADGTINYAFESTDTSTAPQVAQELAPEGQAAALAIAFDELEIHNGYVTYTDDSAGQAFVLTGVDLVTSLQYPREGFYESTGRLRADSVLITMEDSYPPMALEFNYKFGYDSFADDLAIERAQVAVNDVRLKLTGAISRLTEAMSARLNVKSEQLEVAALLSLLPEAQRNKFADYTLSGGFSLDTDLNYTMAGDEAVIDYAGTATLTEIEVASETLTGPLKFSRCLVDFKPDNLKMTIEDGSFDGQPLKGHLVVVDFENPDVSGELAGVLDLKLIESFLVTETDHRLAGRADIELKFSGPIRDPEALDFSGRMVISEGAYASELVPEPIEAFELDAYFDNRLINVRSASCRMPSGQLSLTGRLTDLVPYLLADSIATLTISPTVEATVQGAVDLKIAAPYLPERGNPELAGELQLDVGFAGVIDDLTSFRSQGSMGIVGASYVDSLLTEPIEQFDAQLRLRTDTIEVSRMDAKFTSSDVSFSGQLIRPFPYFLPIMNLNRDTLPKPLFLFELSSHRFDTDRLFPEAVPGSGTETVSISADSISAVILPDIDGRGTVKADTVIYCGVQLTNLEGKVRIQDRRIECYDATANVYTGSVSGKTTIDLSNFENPGYAGEFAATNIEADDFVSSFSKFGGHLFGKGNFEGSYNAHGWEPDAFMNSLTLDGDLDVRDGRLVTSGPVFSVINELASRMGESIEAEQTMRSFASKIKAENGRISTDEIVAALVDLGDLKLNGSYGLDNTIDYAGTFLLTEGRTRKLGLKNLGRAKLPFTMTGTITSPRVDVDWGSLAEQAGEDLLKDAVEDGLNNLKGLFKKKK
jgi:hypothetical protein